ncbi:MAG: hypothetical protein ABI472_20715 [Ginsengibacter sp.]
MNTYSIFDKNPFNRVNFYGLKELDKDGKFTYSPERKIDMPVNDDRVIILNPQSRIRGIVRYYLFGEILRLRINGVSGKLNQARSAIMLVILLNVTPVHYRAVFTLLDLNKLTA